VSPRASSRPHLTMTPLPPARGQHHLFPQGTSTPNRSPMLGARRVRGAHPGGRPSPLSPPPLSPRRSAPGVALVLAADALLSHAVLRGESRADLGVLRRQQLAGLDEREAAAHEAELPALTGAAPAPPHPRGVGLG